MYSHDGGPVLIHTPPPPHPLCSFVHPAQPYAAMVQYPSPPPPLPFSESSSSAAAAAGKAAAAAEVVVPAPAVKAAEVRDVWAGNFAGELATLSAALPHYPWVCVDTEFPGAVHDLPGTPRYLRGPRESYALVKRNVDDLKLLQVGISLSGPAGRCPVAWQFNLRGFDPARDPHAPASVALLRDQGMHFATLNEFGIRPLDLAAGLLRSGLVAAAGEEGGGGIVWTAFSGAYDFAYLAKALTGGRPLPGTLEGFMALVRRLFGRNVLDVKHLARCCGLRGGLEQVAAALGVRRAAGRAHCGGSDSLLTTDVLLAMLGRYFVNVDVLAHAGTIVDLA